VAALTALAALFRVPGLDSGLWYDEIVTLVESVRPPLRAALTTFEYNNHPLYSLLAHLSVLGFGEHAWSLRLPAFAFGVASVPLLYHVAIAVTTRTEALLSALLLAVSYHHVWFSQNARGYTALLFFTLLATLLIVKLLQRPEAAAAIAYGVVVSLGVYTHLTMAFVVIAHAAIWSWHLAHQGTSAERWRGIRAVVAALGVAGVVSALLYLPMASRVVALLSAPPPPASAVVATPRWALLETLRGLRVGFGTLGILAALGLSGVGTVSYLRQNRLAALLFLLPGVVVGLVMLAAGAAMRPRFFFSFLAFGLLCLARGAMELGRTIQQRAAFENRRTDIIGIALVSLIAVVSTASLRYNYQHPKQDYGAALQFVERTRAPNEPVATAGLARFPYARYYQMPWTAVERSEDLGPLRRRADRVWVVYSFEEYMDRGLVAHLRRSCTPRQVFHGTLGGGDIVVCTLEGKTG